MANINLIRQHRSGTFPSLPGLLNSTEIETWDCDLVETSGLSDLRSVTTLGFVYIDLTVKFNQRVILSKDKAKIEEKQTRTHSCGGVCIKGASDEEKTVKRGGNQKLARRTGAISQWLI